MKKTYEEQYEDIKAKEMKKAKEMGFDSVQELRKYFADQNRKKTYLVKIERYKKAIAKMEEWIETH